VGAFAKLSKMLLTSGFMLNSLSDIDTTSEKVLKNINTTGHIFHVLSVAEDYATVAEMFTYSASQIKLFRDCPRKWAYAYVFGRKTDAGAGAALGTEIHSQLEAWLTKKIIPEHTAAKALLVHLPHPHEKLHVEHAFSLLTKSGVARGFIDVLVTDSEGLVLPEHLKSYPRLPIVIDHKSTADIKYALSATDLEHDPQAILYGLEARVQAKTTDDVILNWGYTQTRGKAATKAVHLRQTQSMFEDGFLRILEDAGQMSAIMASDCTELSVPFDTDACDDYGGCPHREVCPAYSARGTGISTLDKLDGLQGKDYTTDMGFLEDLAKASAAPFVQPVAAAVEAAVTPSNTAFEPTPEPKMPPIQVVTTGTSSVLPPEIKKKPKKKASEGETLSVESLVRQALTAAVEVDNLHAMSVLAALLSDLNSPGT
jgi:hypothetical protein